MKRIIIAAALLAPVAALAQPAAPKEPTTIILPSQVVAATLQYLNTQPRGNVEALATAIEACARVQIPNGGVLVSHGECPEVAAALHSASPSESMPAGVPHVPPAKDVTP